MLKWKIETPPFGLIALNSVHLLWPEKRDLRAMLDMGAVFYQSADAKAFPTPMETGHQWATAIEKAFQVYAYD